MHNRRIQDKFGKYSKDGKSIKNNTNEAFIESLKKQISFGGSSSNVGADDSSDGDTFSEDLLKEIETELFNELFADLDDDD